MSRLFGFKNCQLCKDLFYETLEYYDSGDSGDSDNEDCVIVQRSETGSPFCDGCCENRPKECTKMTKRAKAVRSYEHWRKSYQNQSKFRDQTFGIPRGLKHVEKSIPLKRLLIYFAIALECGPIVSRTVIITWPVKMGFQQMKDFYKPIKYKPCKEVWHTNCDLVCVDPRHLCIICAHKFCKYKHENGSQKVQPSGVMDNVCIGCCLNSLQGLFD